MSQEESLATISQTTQSHLSLYKQRLGYKTNEELVMAFKAIPSAVTHLNLGLNYLGSQKASSELVAIFKALPYSIISLDLSCNAFSKQSSEGLAQIFTALPSSVTHLNLGGNFSGDRDSQKLVQILKALPVSVAYLSLKNNDLCSLDAIKLAEIFAALPRSVIDLDLSNNFFRISSSTTLEAAFAALPIKVKKLNLSDNGFNKEGSLFYLHRIFKSLATRYDLNIECEKDLAIVQHGVFKTLPLYLCPKQDKFIHGSPFANADFRSKQPLLFRDLTFTIQDNNENSSCTRNIRIPENIVTNVYSYLNYKAVSSLMLARISNNKEEASNSNDCNKHASKSKYITKQIKKYFGCFY